MISIFTLCAGRFEYLERLIDSLRNSEPEEELEHHICFQGVEPPDALIESIKRTNTPNLSTALHLWGENIGIAAAINRIVPLLRGDIIIKMDEDCMIQSARFFAHVRAVHRLKPSAVFSPYPVGLIHNPGGILSSDRITEYSDETDTYYTLRRVNYLGGLARITPAELIKQWTLSEEIVQGHSGRTDTQISALCVRDGIEMFYLENALIVEHQESTLGQYHRYGKDYFGERLAFQSEAGILRWMRLRARLIRDRILLSLR